jgi:hypothetical protein
MTLRVYVRTTPAAVLVTDALRVVALLAATPLALAALRWVTTQSLLVAPIHRQLWAHPAHVGAGRVYTAFVVAAFLLNAAWITTALRNLVAITLARSTPLPGKSEAAAPGRAEEQNLLLPPYPYSRESFALVLGELQDRDGSRVPNERSPGLTPRWLMLPELALYTGVFVTGGIGSGKTSAVAYPALKQLLGFRRPVPVRRKDGNVVEEDWKFSGLILDEKGDFTRMAAKYCEEWGRAGDLIRISPGGVWIWNIIYNPNLPTWAVGYQLGWIIRQFNKGAGSSDPFWENAPRELTTEYLGLLDDAEGYYTIFDYLEVLIDDEKQDTLHEKSLQRFAGNRDKEAEIDRRWKAIQRRREGMGVNLRGSLEACARAGIDMFRQPELRRTFCPTKEEYFEKDPATGTLRPRPNVFTGFDQVLDYGKIVGLEMPKQIFFDAAIFTQVALKAQWADSVLRRDGTGPDGKPLLPPRFGERIGYCPTFLMADEAQISANPRDGEFKAVCRSKRASMWELTQSHSSIKGSFGQAKAADADTYFQNSMTHIYLRQSDPGSMKIIQEQLGKKLVQKTTLAITEAGSASELSYVQGEIVHEGLNISSSKTVATEEKPFLEIDDLKRLPNNVAVVTPSNGDNTLPATICYLRPLWIYEKYPDLPRERSWLDWNKELRANYDLSNIPQSVAWKPWAPIDEAVTVAASERLGKFVQAEPPLAQAASALANSLPDSPEPEAAPSHGHAAAGRASEVPLEIPEPADLEALLEEGPFAHIRDDETA